MFTPGCHQALATATPSPFQASLGPRRWRQAAPPAPLPTSTMANRRRALVSCAAINIPPDALVHPFRKTFGTGSRWGMEKVEKKEGEVDEKVKLWFLLPGVDESRINDEVVVDLPDGSNLLTIKKTKKDVSADDESLDVRLLLTAGYIRDRIGVVKGKNGEGKLLLEVTIERKATKPQKIYIK